MSQPLRAAAGGHIDRRRTLGFRFDGRSYAGHPGDTLASALLANGVRLVGRSFKYHRPRGIYAAGPEEPNALVAIGDGARRTPNTRATTAELYDGLAAESQNRWPSLRWDLQALAAVAAPLLPAGFYYKTFMWPPRFWERVYEPLIRRAAGLGIAARAPDPDHYETAHAHCDVLVVGTGPAGLAAARAAAAAGARVIVCEQDFLPGGGLLLDPSCEAWRAASLADLDARPNVTTMLRTTVFGCYDGGVAGAIERLADHLPAAPAHGARQRYWTIRARETVLAAGADERLIAFPGNDAPGVMLAGAARAYAARWGVLAGQRVVLFTNNDSAYRAAESLAVCGASAITVVDVRTDSPRHATAIARGIGVLAGHEVVATGSGGGGLYAVEVRRRGDYGTAQIGADLLAVSGGWSPAVQLASQARVPLAWRGDLAAYVPGDGGPARSAGAARGAFGIARAAADGAAAGAAAAAAAGFPPGTAVPLPADTGDGDDATMAFWSVPASGKAFVDLQNDVTAKDIRLAAQEGYADVEHAKRYTTHTMATDQGRTGGLVGVAVLAEARGVPVEAVGMPTFRPYAHPITWGAIAGHHVGKAFQPTRRTPLHRWHLARGAEMMEAGLWMRPSFYPRPGESAWDAILREARAVRQAVGICDVSTLGKIDVQGPDAATFLDRLYVNTFSTLPVGKARYGLMLREDGMVFDDGTTSRLAEDRFFVTTTTANAARVLEHMEFHLQAVWPDLDVQVASVTDQWASMSLAGPRARETLARVVSGCDLANDAFPFMAVGEGAVAGCPVRLFRISFSGELAYEVATPAGHAVAVWEAILAAGSDRGIEPYGVEALGLLRIEKGHVAGAEINGQTTLADLGLARMAKKRGDFVGRTLAMRPGLTDPTRPALVGVRPVDPERQIRAGGHLVASGAMLSQGHVTSVMRSVALGGWVGLGLLSGGAARTGERMDCVYPLLDERVPVMVRSPHFVDPENARVRA
ncbi:MAG: sarcosine oxidase subunit alpha family protein [Alphaproteobacteria bacterium]